MLLPLNDETDFRSSEGSVYSCKDGQRECSLGVLSQRPRNYLSCSRSSNYDNTLIYFNISDMADFANTIEIVHSPV